MFFQHEYRFRYKFFRYCSIFKVLCAAALAADDLIILPQKRFFVKHIFEKLLNFSELGALHTSQCQLVFSASIGSFQGLPAELSEVILLSQRLALTYSTIPQPLLQVFFTFFSPFFALCIHQPVFRSVSGDVLTFLPPFLRKNSRRTKSAAAVALGFSSFLPVSSPAGSARPLLPTSAARQSGQWAWVPVHYNRRLQG